MEVPLTKKAFRDFGVNLWLNDIGNDFIGFNLVRLVMKLKTMYFRD